MVRIACCAVFAIVVTGCMTEADSVDHTQATAELATTDEQPTCRDVETTCSNGRDEDCDGRVDCEDADCSTSLACVDRCEPTAAADVCGNNLDDDCDFRADCDDLDCASTPECQPVCVPSTEACANRADDDCDGLSDCADPDCTASPACEQGCTPSTEICSNGADEDCDGAVDCADSDCAASSACNTFCEPASELCGNGLDEDCDGAVDCADSDCSASSACNTICEPASEICGNGLDEDCDGRVDCEDPDCSGTTPCTVRCEDTEGNGCNGDLGYGDRCDDEDNEEGCSPARFLAWCNRRNADYPDIWHTYLRTWVDSRCDGVLMSTSEQYSDYFCEDSSGVTYRCRTPLVLSFDGAPVRYLPATAGAAFDFSSENDGRGTAHDWPTTPWLAMDRDGDGRITSARELFGSATPVEHGIALNGFDALAALDANRDRVIDVKDPLFAKLLVWADDDGDRVSAAHELRSLDEVGVVSISLQYERAPRCDARGNCEVERAVFLFRRADGLHEGATIDVHLREQSAICL